MCPKASALLCNPVFWPVIHVGNILCLSVYVCVGLWPNQFKVPVRKDDILIAIEEKYRWQM
jgi:hypothetical protein